MLPLIISHLAGSLSFGFIISRTGYILPFLIAGGAILSIGCGLLTTFNPHTPTPLWIVYQMFVGCGAGLGIQAALLPAQTVLPDKDIAIGLSMINFGFVFGGAVMVPVAQVAFLNVLTSRLQPLFPSGNGTGLDGEGATALLNRFSANEKQSAVSGYNYAVVVSFYIALAAALLSFVSAFGVKASLSVIRKKKNQEADGGEEEEKKVGTDTCSSEVVGQSD